MIHKNERFWPFYSHTSRSLLGQRNDLQRITRFFMNKMASRQKTRPKKFVSQYLVESSGGEMVVGTNCETRICGGSSNLLNGLNQNLLNFRINRIRLDCMALARILKIFEFCEF